MLLKRFWSSRAGNFAMMFGVALIPMVLGAGVAVDYSRMLRAKSHLQAIADATALALAASRKDDQSELESDAGDYIQANFNNSILDAVNLDAVHHDGESYDVDVSGRLPTMFMSIANVTTLDVSASALAVRGVTGSVELALVLDNTFSMSEADSSGVTKMAALKSAANDLVDTLHNDEDAHVRVSVVPYADNVNVGTSHRYDSWLDIEDEYVETVPESCSDTKWICPGNVYEPTYSCMKNIDGVDVPSTCGGGCAVATQQVPKDPGEPKCSAAYTRSHTWLGCVGSRTTGTLRLTDGSTSVPYPGYVDTNGNRKCPTPIVPMTSDMASVRDAIDGMKFESSGYRPLTYIPAGLIWGLNVLSPTVPFSDGKAYDPKNADPRKVVVLMTDGENTLRFRSSDGRAVAFGSTGKDSDGNAIPNATQVEQTRNDTLSICNTMKSKNIEIFSVAFAVDSDEAKSLLQTCATDTQHYFDAANAVALQDSFQQIANALTNVRLAR